MDSGNGSLKPESVGQVQGAGGKPSKVEAVKRASDYLKSLVTEVDNGETHFTEDAATLLKFHGSYQQDDRDVRTLLKREGKEKSYQFMVRVRVPGGKLTTADQYLACARLAETVGNGTLRITTRQEFQLHGVLQDDLAATVKAIERDAVSSTLAACGDVGAECAHCRPRAPTNDPIHTEDCRCTMPPAGWRRIVRPSDAGLLGHLARRRKDRELYLPRCRDRPKVLDGRATMPSSRFTTGVPALQFKTAFGPRGQLHRYSRERTRIPRSSRTRSSAITSWSAGDWARRQAPRRRSPSSRCRSAMSTARRFSKLARPCSKSSATSATAPTASARLKYIILDWGHPGVPSAKIEEYLGPALADPKPVTVSDVDDHLGWHEQGDGKLYLGIPVENGRIKNDGPSRLFDGLKAFFEKYEPQARLIASRRSCSAEIDPPWKPAIESWLSEYESRRWSR